MAEFPSGVYAPRTKENASGEVYEPDKTTLTFAEDITKLDDEVVAIETVLLTARTKHIHLGVEAFRLGAQAPTPAVIGHFAVYKFSNVTKQTADITFHVPVDWDGVSDILIHVHWAPGNGGAGDVVWDIDYKAVMNDDGEVISGTQRNLTITDSTNELQDESLKTANMVMPKGDFSAGDMVGICLSRDTADENDTYGDTANLIMAEILYEALITK